jgi:DNA polymerase-3 subunit gamma/tau
MLSTGAFNALLKTLEEPPKHVIFILATTEPHKIPATIHSRCQRFDFRGVSVPDMIARMNTIIEHEGIRIDKEAVKVIAEGAEGGMRDAISLLDQVVSYTEDSVSVEDVHAIKGTVSNEKLLTVAEAIKDNDSVTAIRLLDELVMAGKEAPRLVENLIEFYRDMLLFKNTNVSEEDQLIFGNPRFVNLAKTLSNNMLFYYIDVLNKTQNDMKWTTNAKLYMELALIKLVDKVEKQELLIDEELHRLRRDIDELRTTLATRPVQEDLEDEPSDEEEPFEWSLPEVEEVPVENDPIEDVEEQDQEEAIVTKSVRRDPPEDEQETSSSKTEESPTPGGLFDLEVEEEQPSPKPEVEEEPYTTYDIRYVEDVLNNGDREAKIKMNKRWFDIERFAGPERLNYAKWVTSGRLVATNGTMMIIEYANASLCNRMMRPDVKDIILPLLSEFYETDINYLALPKDVWERKSQEFIKKWREHKDTYIKLTPIEHPGLKDMPTITKEVGEFTPDSVKAAIELFGSEAVRVKKGDE